MIQKDNFIPQIKKGECVTFLHVKTSGVPCGSVGYAVFKNKVTGEKIYIGWSTPHSKVLYKNTLGVEVLRNGEKIDGIERLQQQHNEGKKEKTTENKGMCRVISVRLWTFKEGES